MKQNIIFESKEQADKFEKLIEDMKLNREVF